MKGYPPPEQSEAWDRQAGESAKAFQAFGIYRDLGPARSLLRVGQELGKARALLERWSSKYSWTTRARDWDSELDRRAREAQAAAIQAMGRGHAGAAACAIRALMVPVQELTRRIDTGDEIFAHLAPEELLSFAIRSARALERLTQVERLSRGDPPRSDAEDVATGNIPDTWELALSQAIERDPEIARLASDLFARVTQYQSH